LVPHAGRAHPEDRGVRRRVIADDPGHSIPLQQAGDKASKSKGLGIGLSLVARFAELHLGRAWVEERAVGGASFHVFLPSPRPEHT
jgi:signal transduction histidine kinase